MMKYGFLIVFSCSFCFSSFAQTSFDLVTERIGNVSINLVKVQGGTYTMGSNSDEDTDNAEHSVQVGSFQMMETEVTQAFWLSIMGTNPSHFKDCPECPVENVSWSDVQVFIKKLNEKTGKAFRLPTEAEWEFAARGGIRSKGYTFSGSSTVEEVLWCRDNSDKKSHPVKSKKPNELGLYDMSGNVWEWCSDWYAQYAQASLANPKGPSTGARHVGRGGSWFDQAQHCSVVFRCNGKSSHKSNDIGFRLVLPLAP